MKASQIVLTLIIAAVVGGGIAFISTAGKEKAGTSGDTAKIAKLEAKIKNLESDYQARFEAMERKALMKPDRPLAKIDGKLGGKVDTLQERVASLEDRMEGIQDIRSGLASDSGDGEGSTSLAEKVIEEIQKNPEKLMRGMMNRHRSSSADRMAERLGLDDDQKAKVKAITDEMSKKMREIWSNRNQDEQMTREERRALMEKAREDMDLAMQEILTPDQYDKFKEMNQGGRGGMGGMFGGRRGRSSRGGRGGGGNRGGGGDRGGGGPR
ncbi:MAG: hypothetical protein E3J72_03130 [Planctomycetota bacterium]|nr:MAG: hypothetical protein E3J72_03130 [Planctomycetota bacterium]